MPYEKFPEYQWLRKRINGNYKSINNLKALSVDLKENYPINPFSLEFLLEKKLYENLLTVGKKQIN
ncbi:MAG: hypothetical protein ABIC91_07190 [Nanoarchaeota archaeon]|nr:hypothetical protein [Nanoarchaeota archaeon]MBU1031091.1 hypothetical protein [Nanoarchaeota archaeon]MBU1849688.1 hypothetical protein [Nanoarchaeota archaeon]